MSRNDSSSPENAGRERRGATLAELDRGHYEEAAAGFDAASPPEPDGDLGSRIRYAEVALYLDGAAEAAGAVAELERDLEAQLAEPGELGELARRGRLVAAEAALALGDLDAAERKAASVSDAAATAGAGAAAMRARYDLGRIAGRRGEHAVALERLAAAARLADDLGAAYYQGLIAHHRALFLEELGEVSAAERRYAEAVELLGASENGRRRAAAQVGYGNLLADLGRNEEALELLARAEPGAGDARRLHEAVAKGLLGLKRFDEAAARLETLVALEREAGDRGGELRALRLLTQAELGRGRLDAAERAATSAAELAAAVGSAADAVETRLLAGRVRARAGRPEAADDLRAVLDEAERAGDATRRAEALIYLAEALVVENPIDAEQLVREARALPAVAADPSLQSELDRVERERLRAPVRIAQDGTLVVDTRGDWPKLKQAREALERYLLERSLEETQGNAAAAGRLIGETRYQMHYLRRIFERGEGRPSRARAPEEEESERSRRSASRPKRLVRRRGT